MRLSRRAGPLLALSLAACASLPEAPAPAASTEATATPPHAAASANVTLPLPHGSQRYRFSWDGQLDGEATRSLSCQQNTCELHTEASVPGVATLQESSRFQWLAGEVRFERYQRNLQLLFFPQTMTIARLPDGQIQAERKGKVRTYADQPGLIDTLSLEAQLRADLVLGGKPRDRYVIADSKGATPVTLAEQPGETLTLAGKMHATRVFRRQNDDGSRVTTLWLDPAQAFLPLQIIHRDGAETYRLTWAGPAAH